ANARIYQRVDEDLSRRIEQIVRVSEISRRLSSTLEMESVFDLIIDQAVDGCGADYAVLVLTEDPQLGNLTTSMELNMVAWRGFDRSKAVLAPHQVAESLVKSPVLAEGRSTLETRPAEQATGRPRSHMSVPIMIEGRVIGALALEAMQPQAFNDDDMAFVSQLAIQAATAIRNAQLYRRAETVRDRLNAILDASSDGMLMIDEQMRIVMTNTRMGDFWNFARGYENAPDERMMDDPLAVLGEGLGYKSGELRALVRYAMQNPNMPPQTDLTVVGGSPGEKQRFVERTAMPVRDERGAFIGLLLLFRDVTQEKELEEARENLTSMMVHDLRGPLTAVMTSMDLIQKAAGGGNRVINQSTETSKRAVRKLLHMVNDLLDLSRMSDGRLVVDASPTPIADLFDEAALELSPISQELNVMVQVEVPDDLPAAYADRGMVERVVLNLLDNALKYTDPGTLVTMRASQPDEHDGHLLIEIIDQGPGVPDDFKAVIFDRFKQIPGRRGRRHSAGIGLAFCRLAVEAHGGRIWVEDNPEGGSIFSFTLPTDKAPARNGATA
ncbi:MAG: GAF domain-containing protein, partial [Chloroflexi bacterium]|nr:GAF domain-containing protein [Chloroflexota bacterium]